MTDPDAVLGVLTGTKAGMVEEVAGDVANEAALAAWGVVTCPRAGMAEELGGDVTEEAALAT